MVSFDGPHRDPEHGYWRARITCEDITLDADLKSGSWLCWVPLADGKLQRRDVTPWIASDLARKVRKLEKAEREQADAETTLVELPEST